MTSMRGRWLSRTAVGLGAALALIVATAGTAAADLPNNVAVSGDVVGGNIRVNAVNFPLGEDDPDPDPCNPNEDPATLDAVVGPIVNGVAPITDIETVFPPAAVGEFGGDPVCATIVVTNDPEGTQTGGAGDESGTVAIDSPGIVVAIEFNILDCVIEPIQMPNGDPIDLTGSISHLGSGNPWDLTLEAEDGFEVPEASGTICEFLGADDAISDAFPPTGLPTTDTEATFEFVVQ